MVEGAEELADDGPLIRERRRISGPARLLIAAFGIVGLAIGTALLEPAWAQPFLLGLLVVMAVIGLVALLAGAVGLLRIGTGRTPDELSSRLINALDEGLLVTDAAGRVIFANHAYARILGGDESAGGRSLERAFAGNADAAEAIFRIGRKLRDGAKSTEEVRLPHSLNAETDDGARWYRISAEALKDEGRQSARVVWRIADISQERAKQEQIFQELQHAIDYLDHAPAGFLSAEPDGRIVHMNATLAEWLGIDLSDFTPGSIRLEDIVQGDGIALLSTPPDHTRRNRTALIDLDLVKRSGQNLPVRLLHKVPTMADGAPGATRTIVLNRSPGEDVSEALRQAEVRFTRFFNHTPIAIAAVNREGRIGRSNAPFVRLFAAAAPFTRLVDLVVEADRPKFEAALKSAADGAGSIPSIDARLVGDGEQSARFYISPVTHGSDQEAVIVNALDITEQRKLEQQFAQSQKMQAVGQLAGGIAHDFNNVLTAIIGFSDLLLANHRPSDPSFQDIMNIKQNANRAAGLVRQLLAFSRRQTLLPQVLSLGDVLSDLAILLERLLGENVKLEMVHGRELWAVKVDINQLEQVIINLAVNGRDAMPAGGTMTISTRNLPADEVASFPYHPLPPVDYVLTEVADTGTGIPTEVQEKIFEPFFSTKEVGKGTGLGLSTVYGIVKQTGGHIFFRSEAGTGTAFHIFLPRYEPQEGDQVAGPTDSDSQPEIEDLTGTANILLVEDEEAVRAFAARALSSRGYNVYEAPSGVEALAVMEEAGGEIDLVVSDVVMPELDGPSLLRELRKTRPDLKIIFISGYAEEAFSKNLPQGETFKFLPKPFSLKQLAVAVKETLGT
ncbi:MAG: cell cycle histidine kinase CckA [Alphaproteobacteria bacterium]